jgi:hypothetical protein
MGKLNRIIIFFFLSLQLNSIATTTYTVGHTGKNYTNITAAYAACILATDYVIEIQSDYSIADETIPISLAQLANKSSSNTVTIRPASGVSGLTISTGAATSVFYFNGADYVIIDGRPGGAGASDFTLENTQTTASNYTIQFINDATYNTIEYCTVKGSSTSSTTGVIQFSTTTGATGNDNNTIQSCTIKNGSGGNPAVGVYSGGTAAKTNGSCTIQACQFIDFTLRGVAVATNSDVWTIQSNHFYQTASITPTAAFYMIYANTGGGHLIRGNYLGGRGANCSGGAYDIPTSAFATQCIEIGSSCSGAAITIDSNVVSNFTHISTLTEGFVGIYVNTTSCNMTIGQSSYPNIIGATSGTGKITLSPTGTPATIFEGIYCNSSGTNTITYNTIGGITVNNPTSSTNGIYGIYTGASIGASSINYNTLGNTTATNISTGTQINFNGIYVSDNSNHDVSSNTFQNINCGKDLLPIYVSGTGTYTINSNTIGSTVSNNLACVNSFKAIYINAAGTFTISGNTIQQVNQTGATGLVQIVFTNSTTVVSATVTSNVIKNITETSATTVQRFFYFYVTTNIVFSSNTISNLTWGATDFCGVYAIINGLGPMTMNSNTWGSSTANNMSFSGNNDIIVLSLYTETGSTTTANNNVVQNFNLTNTGSATTFTGFDCWGPATISLSGDTVRNITSASTSTSNTVRGIWMESSTSTTSSVTQSCVQNLYASTSGATAVVVEGFYFSSKGASITKSHVSGLYTAATSSSAIIAGININTTNPINLFNNVVLLNNGGNTTSPIIKGIALTVASNAPVLYHNTVKVYGTASSGTGIGACLYKSNTSATLLMKNNIFQNVRSTGGGTQYSIYASSTTITTTATADITNNYLENTFSSSNIVFWGANKTLAQWNAFAGATTTIDVGTDVTGTISIDNSYGYPWYATNTVIRGTGTNLSATVTDDKEGTARPAAPWMGAWESFPVALPIKLIAFTAACENDQVKLNWATATEVNNDYFMVQRTADGSNFKTIAIVDGAGNSTTRMNYSFIDEQPLNGNAYYRLKQTDFDGEYVYSSTQPSSCNTKSTFGITNTYPNPVQDYVNLVLNSDKEGIVNIVMYDMRGRKVYSNTEAVVVGVNQLKFDFQQFDKGVYIIKIDNGSTIISEKINKNF